MNRTIAGGLVAMMFGFVALLPSHALAAPAGPLCTGTFTAVVRSGPDTGLVLQGTISLPAVQRTRLETTLFEANGERVRVTGHEHGLDIKLVFHLRDGAKVVGTGQMPSTAGACTGNFGGSFKGPKHRDTGDWGIIWGS